MLLAVPHVTTWFAVVNESANFLMLGERNCALIPCFFNSCDLIITKMSHYRYLEVNV